MTEIVQEWFWGYNGKPDRRIKNKNRRKKQIKQVFSYTCIF